MPVRRLTGHLLLAVLLLGCLPGLCLGQTEEEKTRRQLDQLQRDIASINSEISSASARKSSLQQQLGETEKQLGRLQRSIADNRSAMARNERELTTLQNQRADLEQARDSQQARIALEMKTAWQLGKQGQIKVLLDQESPHTVARAMAYYRYFFEARNELIADYRQTLRELAELETRIAATVGQLTEQHTALQEQEAQLVAAQATRQRTMAELSASISSKSEQLKGLEQNRKQLEDLLRAIEKAVADLAVPDNYQAFRSARGKMPWPVKGRPSNYFGRPRNEGKMQWQGVTIPAAAGTSVKAIHHGRVVYADWLRGSGLLMIIDHGDGYMSLYAHNQSLLREVGEWVVAGTPISTVGNSGGQEKSALYFEIRHKGKPTNPSNWCRG